jgi:hypothetical protein
MFSLHQKILITFWGHEDAKLCHQNKTLNPTRHFFFKQGAHTRAKLVKKNFSLVTPVGQKKAQYITCHLGMNGKVVKCTESHLFFCQNIQLFQKMNLIFPIWVFQILTFKSTSSSALVCEPAKIFFTSKFSYLLFLNLAYVKLKLGQQIGAGLLIANHLDQSLWYNSDHTYYAPFCRCTALLCLLPATSKCTIMLSQNHFQSQTGIVSLFFIQF